jgi:ribulose-phosphate 3-epimerase|tara:strand:- start:327 stop:998 length:672 start_codon:yes stop_codon:yes gene_type:complete
MAHLIAPSVLAADFANIQRDVEMINNSEADWFHIDVMDGVFVPNISFGFPVMEAIKKHATKPLDVHLMIVNPDQYIETFKKAGADILTVHLEACPHLHRTIQAIKQKGMKAGVALNPHTPVHLLKDVIADLDLVCIMSVNPGFGGQKFIRNTFTKVQELKQMIIDADADTLIEIDGGVGTDNAKLLVDCGADVLVAGSSVFKAESPVEAISLLKKLETVVQSK